MQIFFVKLANTLEVTIDLLLLGGTESEQQVFEIKNRKLKELCKKVDQLTTDDQDMICHFLDMAVRQNNLKQVMEGALK